MRSTFALTLGVVLAIGCKAGDTDETDLDTDTGPDVITSAERLGVPDVYEFLWNTENGCDTENGPGTQVYWHTSNAKSVDNGNGTFSFSATETWYWFNGNNSPNDCKDVWEITGQFYTTDYELLGCAGCEEAYSFRRRLTDAGCQVGYHTLFGWDGDKYDAPDPQMYEGYLLFDTHTPNELPFEENTILGGNKILVFARYRHPDGWSLNNNYSQPAMSSRTVDDPSVIGPPGEYSWVGQACIGSGGGGGT